MKKTLLLLFILSGLYASNAFAQAEFSTDTVTTSLNITESDIVGHGFINNLAPQVKNYRWVAEEIISPEGWNWAICDKNNCYTPGVDSMDFTLGPAESGRLDVHVYPDNQSGTIALVKVKVTDLQEPDFTAEGYYLFNAVLTSDHEAELAAIRIFPNPVRQQLQVDGLPFDAKSQLSIYSLDGRQIIEQKFENRSLISMENLPTGLYVLKIQLPEQGAVFQQLIQKQ
ncbi:MAG: T9SS type A sorting domain-containing protein [Bacteroidota bacterium]